MQSQLHYQIDPLSRVDWAEIPLLFEQQCYFVIHAPRQTGKTTTLLAMMDSLNQSGDYEALYVNIEAGQAARNDVDRGLTTICEAIAYNAETRLGSSLLTTWLQDKAGSVSPNARLTQMLSYWSQNTAKP